MKQKGRRKRILSMILGWLLIVSNVLPGISVQAAEQREAIIEEQEVSDKAEVENTSYEIYPTPHSVEYQEGTYAIQDVNLVYDSTIDVAVRNRMKEILEAANINYEITETVAENKTNILIGIYSGTDKKYVQQKMEESVAVTGADFEKLSAHYVVSKAGNIYVLGKDLDAAFYGVTTLKHIFSQLNNNEIRNFTIKDYADVNIRGFIEGYYGIPWSNEDRMSLMKFGGDFKMTSYIFAPKDDIYHTTRWREEYPADMLADIEEMVAVGNASKCRFVWTAHPFMNGGNFGGNNSIEQEIQHLLNKFEQLYGVGVRQFGVLADDVGNVDKNAIVQVMNAISEWAKEKKDVYDTVYCPQGYNHSWQGNYSELNKYDQEFPEDIQIFWTGQAVCQPISVETLNNFRNHNLPSGAESRRAPLFWLNWPVNDINHGRMLMGKGSLLHTDVDPANLAGAVTNPMQEAEASKNALFAVADYTWNIGAFNADTSWIDGFKYIEPDATEELYTLAKHMSDPSPNGHGLVLDESEHIKDMLNEYLASGEKKDELLAEFNKVINACEQFINKSQNESLKDELLPYISSLSDICNAAIQFMEVQEAIDENDEERIWVSYANADAYYRNSKKHVKPTLSGTTIVSPSSKRLVPFVDSLSRMMSSMVFPIVNSSKRVELHTNRTDIPMDALEYITDNKENTEVVFDDPNSIAKDEYLGLVYEKAFNLSNVEFKMGRAGNLRDTMNKGKLQYTTNGTTWEDIPGTSFEDTRSVIKAENLNLTVKGIRIIATEAKTNTWLGVRDIVVNGENIAVRIPGTLTAPEGYSIYQNNVVAKAWDNDEETYLWYQIPNNNCKAGDTFVMDLGAVCDIGEVYFSMPEGDCMTNYTLQYSQDGDVYSDIETFTGRQAKVDLSNAQVRAQYIRVKNNQDTNKWLKISEFTVKQPGRTPVYTNKTDTEVASLDIELKDDYATLKGTTVLKTGEYVGIDLKRIRDISGIEADFDGEVILQTSRNKVEWDVYSLNDNIWNYADARYVRLINNGVQDVNLNIRTLRVDSLEYFPVSVEETNFGNQATHVKAFDKDRTTEAIFQASQHQGKFITYDLGQSMSLESLKLVFHDGEDDYPRHAKVLISSDNRQWEEIMVIGNQDSDNTGEKENTDHISELFPVHEISYYTKEVTGIDREVRYIKFEITRDKAGNDKWVRIREIELNGGKLYIPSVNDPTVLSDAQESENNNFSNLTDGNLSTTYMPLKNEEGSLTCFVPGEMNLDEIVIPQSPLKISNAVVIAHVIDNGIVKEVEVGRLSESLNRFSVGHYKAISAVSVKWEADKLPSIYEIIFNRKDYEEIEPIYTEYKHPELSGELRPHTYDGQPIDISGLEVSSNGLEVEYGYYEKVGESWQQLNVTPSNAGNYGVCIYVKTAPGKTELRSEIIPFTIEKRHITFSDITFDKDKLENINDSLGVMDVSFNNLVSGQGLKVGKDYGATTEFTVSGNKAAVTSRIFLKDSISANNYLLDRNEITKEIIIKEVETLEISGEIDKVYDGVQPDLSLFTVNKNNYEGELSFEYFDVNGNFLEGTPFNAGNYSIRAYIQTEETKYVSNVVDFEISKRALEVNGITLDKESLENIEDTVHVTDVEISGLLRGENLVINEDYEVVSSFSVKGNKAIVTATITLKDTVSANNYTIGKGEASKEISVMYVQDLEISGNISKTYDGRSINNDSISVNKKSYEGDVVYQYYSEDGSLLTEAPIKAGKYSVRVYILDETSEVVSNTLAFEIRKSPLKLKEAVFQWSVSEDERSISVNSLVFEGLIPGDELKEGEDYLLTVSTNTSDVGIIATANILLLGSEKASNYYLTDSMFTRWVEEGNSNESDEPQLPVIHEGIWIEGVEDKVYTGNKIIQSLKVWDGDKLLAEGQDYVVSYKNNINAFEYTDEEIKAFEEQYSKNPKLLNQKNSFGNKAPQAVIKMKGNYTGTRSVFFRIERQDISDSNKYFVDDVASTVNGKSQMIMPALIWLKEDGSVKNLKKGKDFYVVEYDKAKGDKSAYSKPSEDDKGYVLTVSGNGNFKGSQVIRYILSENFVPMSKVSVKGIKPVTFNEGENPIVEFKVTYKGKPIEEGTDFKVSYENHKGAGTGYLILEGLAKEGKGNFVGVKRIPYKIVGTSMSKAKVIGLDKLYYTGKEIRPLEILNEDGSNKCKVIVKVNGQEKVLLPDEYTVTYEKNVAKGTATMILTGVSEKGYIGSKKITFKILPDIIEMGEVFGFDFHIHALQGNGTAGSPYQVAFIKGGVTPKVTVSHNGIELVEGRDYTVSYRNNKVVAGLQSGNKVPCAIIKGKGNYTGQLPIPFEIVQKNVELHEGVYLIVSDKLESTKKNGWKQNFKIADIDGKLLSKQDADLQNAVYSIYELPNGYQGNLKKDAPLDDPTLKLPVNTVIQIKVEMNNKNYSGSITGTYRITDQVYDISKAKIVIEPQKYTGDEVTISDNDCFKTNELNIKGSKYPLYLEVGESELQKPNIEVVEGSYKNNTSKGTAKVTFRGIDGFCGLKTVTFKIGQRSITEVFNNTYEYWK